MLSRVAWASDENARAAIDELADRVCALGFVVSEATSSVVPFLLELAEIPDGQCKLEIIELITAIYAARQWNDAAAAAAPQYRSNFEDKVSWELNSKAAVLAGAEVIESLAHHIDPQVAGAARHLLDMLGQGDS
ncbi:hypothetical protein [Streptomyces sp. NBC_00648]|uniref:hypothetical protein n=1 Tax=Streptomyces sp. NBC_00648 TaxID=2975797 RepID=UPI00324C84ED